MKFRAELSDFKLIYNVLRSIAFREFAIIHPTEEGLKVTVEEMKCVETSAYIPASLFSSYHVDTTEDIQFKISLKVLTECLHIYGDDGSSSLKLSYEALGSPLCLVLKHNEENISVDCEIQTMNTDEFVELHLSDEHISNKIVLNASALSEVLNELDPTSDDFQISISPDPPYFRITTSSAMGESIIDISKNSEMVDLYECSKKLVSTYAFSNIKQILKVLNLASKVSITIGETGLLALQLVVNSNEIQMFVEYYVTALFGLD
ncbi:Repair protein Rad1/Rec1/Rad17 [Popillia japonica]|uniref:Repair protein Rad1/Rec1/Rad17 n=1 Tax=Popillia japonica TaxID=7064 RepID=A0AAW1MAL4_POPJA